MSETSPLRGKTALISGAGRGIGAAIARDLADFGANVILSGRNADRLQEVADGIGPAATALPGDICTADWATALQATPVDIFVHSAAAYAEYGPLEDCDETEIRAVLDTVLLAALRTSAAVLPHMKKAGYGRLVFIGSRAASLGAGSGAPYSAAKGGLEALAKSLTVETANTGVTVNVVEPGLIDTERTREAMHPAARDNLARNTPAGRIGTPADVAAAVRYLVSPEADYVRGVTLRVDGGLGLGLPRSAGKS